MLNLIKKTPLTWFFIFAYLLSWSIWIPQLLKDQGLLSVGLPGEIKDLAVYGPSFAAFIIVAILQGKKGLKTLIRSITIWKIPLPWYIIAIFGAAITGILSLVIALMLGLAELNFVDNPPFYLFPLFLVWVIIFGGPLGEEFGWRGYALPKLMARMGPYKASLVLGLLWSMWHLPLFYISETVQSELSVVAYTMMTIPLTFLYTWIYNNTAGSTLIAVLFHGASNTVAGFLPFMPVAQSGGTEETYYIFIAMVWLITIIMLIMTRSTKMGYDVPVNVLDKNEYRSG